MRLLRWVVLGSVLCGVLQAQKKTAPKLKPDPKSLGQTMVWLRESITQQGGFALTKPAGATLERLSYQFQGQDVCHLSWRAVAVGDEDLKSLYPGVEQEQDLAAIVPGSVVAQPMDVGDLLVGGTGQVTASGAAGGIYWRLTALYVDGRQEALEPFGFVFANMETAQRVAGVMEHGVNLCSGPNAPAERESDVGCDSSPTLKVVYEGAPPKTDGLTVRSGKLQMPIEIDGHTGQMKISTGRLVNHNGEAVSCVFVLSYYAPLSGLWVRDAYVTFDLAVGESMRVLDIPRYVDASQGSFYHQCFPEGAVNVHQQVCADLNHSTHPVVTKEKAKSNN